MLSSFYDSLGALILKLCMAGEIYSSRQKFVVDAKQISELDQI